MTNSGMTCEALDATLSDYLEGTLDGSTHDSVEQHLRQCLRCAALVRDIEKIQEEAAVLPDLVPSRNLWIGIEARIAAPVIPLAARSENQRHLVPAWIGIAAAALVVSTAGITYLLTARSLRTGDGRVVSGSPVVTSTLRSTNPDVQSRAGASDSESIGTRSAPEPGGSSIVRGSTTPLRSPVAATLVRQGQASGPSQSEAVYGKEIAMLQTIVSQRKTQLDSSTVAIIEKNLQIIDAAIDQSKAALMKDPASMLLSQQLTHALDKKVELLRTAAMLPAST
jgi:hypothetical protein